MLQQNRFGVNLRARTGHDSLPSITILLFVPSPRRPQHTNQSSRLFSPGQDVTNFERFAHIGLHSPKKVYNLLAGKYLWGWVSVQIFELLPESRRGISCTSHTNDIPRICTCVRFLLYLHKGQQIELLGIRSSLVVSINIPGSSISIELRPLV